MSAIGRWAFVIGLVAGALFACPPRLAAAAADPNANANTSANANAKDAGAADVAQWVRQLDVAQDASSEELARAHRALAALAALGATGNTEAVRALVRGAVDHDGLFRAEVSDLLTNLGERATAGLIIEWRAGATPAHRRFAGAQLEAMERRMPGEAIQTKSQEALGDVLRAYGTVKDMDALGVVLSFTNADRQIPREAARQSLVDYGASALGKLREAYASFMNRPAPDEWTPDQLAHELFAAYDRDRRKEMYVLLDDGLSLLKRAREKTPPDPALLEKAIEAFDKILARAPSIERRSEMVPAYVLLAQAVEVGDGARATALYRKAADLDPKSPRMAQIQGALLALEARELRQRGVTDEETLQRAVALDPANAIARSELAAIEQTRSLHTDRIARVGWMGAATCAIGLALLVVFAIRRRLAR